MEKYIGIYKASDLNKRVVIRPGEEASFSVNAKDSQNRRYRLFFTGETNTYYTWKSEPDCWVNYGKIDDSLNSKDSYKAQYCLKLEGCDYPKIVYKKLLGQPNLNYLPASYFDVQKWQPVLSYLPLKNFTDDWTCGIFVKGENIVKKENCRLLIRFEIRENKRGISRHDITLPADLEYIIDFPDGNYDWQEISKKIVIPADTTSSVCVFIEAENFEGNLYLETPFLVSSNGFNILPDFSISTSQRPIYNWLGQNLSKKEWPRFDISINGNTFFEDEIFERCHRNSECEIDIPDGFLKDGDNTVTIKLISDFRDAPPYSINEVALLEEPKFDFDIISCPDVATAGEPFSLLLSINKPVSLKLEGNGIKQFDNEALDFADSGLKAIRLITNNIVNDLTFTLSSENHTEKATIKRIVEKPCEDNIITGTSDMVYIKQSVPDMENYIRFFMGNNLGNLMTIRPVYRWSGTRKYNPEVFERFVPLMNKLGMKYANMTDGREPEGQCSNPPIEVLSKTYDGIESGFLGRQKHEQDGAYNYWFYNDFSDNYERELHYDLMVRNFLDYPDTTSHYEHTPDEQFFIGDDLSIFKHKGLPRDMHGIADYVVSQLKNNKYNNTRHTGPSIMFKYFYEAGFDWVGAELMYGPLEPVVAAMRGAYRSYGKTNGYGAHLALQWSTMPHDAPEKYRRYRLALFLSYMHGISEINTEEGIMHMEEYFSYFNRFDECCKEYLNEQKNFYNYVKSHTRTGEFYSPIAFIHGRYDGFSCFNRTRTWGNESFNFSDAEKSWDLVKLFYPLSELDGLYCHFCPTDHALGFYTGTPRGNTDIIPIEVGDFKRYKALSFAAYNKAESEDFDRILNYVKEGGTIILGWPHLSVTTDRESIERGKLSYINHEIVDIVSGAHAVFARDFYNGVAIDVCRKVKADEIIATTDSGLPLAFVNRVGKGKIYFINASQYPSHDGVKNIYEQIVAQISDEINARENSFVSCGDDVGFTIYDQNDGSRHIYIIAVDWYRDPDTMRHATLKVGKDKYDLSIPFGLPIRVTVKNNIAAWSENTSMEILHINENIITVQGYGKCVIKVASNGNIKDYTIDFTHNALQAIAI